MADEFLTGIDIVIPNWNGRHMLEFCLPSLSSQNYQDFTVFVIDNGSSDDSIEYLRSSHPGVEMSQKGAWYRSGKRARLWCAT